MIERKYNYHREYESYCKRERKKYGQGVEIALLIIVLTLLTLFLL